MNKQKRERILLGMLVMISFFFFTPVVKAEEKGKPNMYNVVIFVRFNDEGEFVNDNVKGNADVLDVINNTYNTSGYSIREYFKSISNQKVDMETVYLSADESVLQSFQLPENRGYYAAYSANNPEGYQSSMEDSRVLELKKSWSIQVQKAISKNIHPKTYDGTEIAYEDLDRDNDGRIDSMTVIFQQQKQSNFGGYWREVLWSCMDENINGIIQVPKKNGGTITTKNFVQITAQYGDGTLYTETPGGSDYFLTTGIAAHEMGHAFGYRDLYVYGDLKAAPVGYLSAMGAYETPVTQSVTAYERFQMGWLEQQNVGTITGDGKYTVEASKDSYQDGIVTYKLDLPGYVNRTLYVEYRYTGEGNQNRFDSYEKEVYSEKTKQKQYGKLKKSGVVAYTVDPDVKFPTNANYEYFKKFGYVGYYNMEVLGGDEAKKKSDAPLAVGESIEVAGFDQGTMKYRYSGITVSVTEMDAEKAVFEIKGTGMIAKPEAESEQPEAAKKYTIYGKVSGADTFDGIKNASVVLKRGSTVVGTSVKTDYNGYYHFENVPEGEYTIEAAASGYETGILSTVAVKGGDVTKCNFELVRQYTLQSVVAPEAVTGLANGIDLATVPLPSKVLLNVSPEQKVWAEVVWNVKETIPTYKKNDKNAQTFLILGTVTLPKGVSASQNPLKTSIMVTVNAASEEAEDESDIKEEPKPEQKPPSTGNTAPIQQVTKKKKTISIKKKSYDKALNSKAFLLKASVTGKEKIKYYSSDKKVATVDSKGKVTIKGIGTACITMKSEESKYYSAAKVVKVTITVRPKKTVITKSAADKKKASISLQWKKDKAASGYEICYAVNSKFKNSSKIRVKSYKTTKKTIKNLKKGKTYYIRIRTYKTKGKKTYYSDYRVVKVKI